MAHESSFGPAAQTPAQRAEVLARMQQALPRLRKRLSPYVQQLHARYLAGELTWLQVCLALGIEPSSYRAPAQ
ncbi:MAG: hypothetical protein ACRYFK_11820 [Janthinobacterium lividum]